MIPASLPRTSGLRLLRPLLSVYSSASNHQFLPKTNRQQKPNNTLSPSLSLSLSISKSRTFCTSSSTTTSPSTPPPTSSSTDDTLIDILKIKNIANTLDIRVGKILKAWRHEEADSLYVEEVDVGEPVPRIICSGLVKYIPLDDLQGKSVVVLANLKPRNMRGVKSFGMLMAASDGSHDTVELLEPPEGSVPGERVWFGTEDEKEKLPEASSANQIAKKKIWEQVQPSLVTTGSCVASLGGVYLMVTSGGSVVSKSLGNANIA